MDLTAVTKTDESPVANRHTNRWRQVAQLSWVLSLALHAGAVDAFRRPINTKATTATAIFSQRHLSLKRPAFVIGQTILDIRGGATDDEEDEDYDEEEAVSDDDEEEEEYDEEEDEYDVEDDDEEEDEDEYEDEEEEEEEDDKDTTVASSSSSDVAEQEFDETLFPSPFAGIYVTFGVMILAKKLDLTSPKVATFARAAYIGYIIVMQLFLAYVRIKAKQTNDRTPITVNNPLSSALQGQLDGMAGGGNGMMKMLASSLLSSSTTVLEYDLSQAKSMQRGTLFNMAFQWFLHFKMKQVQPLMIQTGSGLLNLFYSPLFQIYILGRNLERPFKMNTTSMAKLQELQEQQAAAAAEAAAEESVTGEEEDAATTKKITEKADEEEEENDEEEEEEGFETAEEEEEDDEEADDDEADEDDEGADDEEAEEESQEPEKTDSDNGEDSAEEDEEDGED